MTMPGFTAEAALQPSWGLYAAAGRGTGYAGEAAVTPQWLPGIGEVRCAIGCKGKAGYLACVARCLIDGQRCDGGVDNCS